MPNYIKISFKTFVISVVTLSYKVWGNTYERECIY